MKFLVQKSVFSKALQTVNRSIAARATLPALSGVLMEVAQDQLTLSGSNLETAIRVQIPVKAEEEGVFLAPSKILVDFVASLPDVVLQCETKEMVLSVVAGKSKSTFTGMSYEEYPELGFDGHATPHVLPTMSLASAIDRVGFAASSDDARAILTGLHFHVRNDVFELAATDGFRLAVERIPLSSDDEFSLVIPMKVMIELGKLVRESSGDSAVIENGQIKCGKTSEGTQMLFVLPDGVQLISRLLEGTFPPYQKIIPTSYTTRVTFDVDMLAAEVKRAALFSSGGSAMLRVDVEAEKHVVLFSSNSPQVGEYKGEINCKVEGSDNRIAFNSRYLLDFLGRIKAKEVCLEMNRTDTPGMWKAVGLDDYLYVVMPMNRD